LLKKVQLLQMVGIYKMNSLLPKTIFKKSLPMNIFLVIIISLLSLLAEILVCLQDDV